jgi:hypothetical protein
VTLDGEISVKGGKGGNGGPIGNPGNGGTGGNAGPGVNTGRRGGDGGSAGGALSTLGFTGGRGGNGGFGGSVLIQAPVWSIGGIIHREGGQAGEGGPGVPAGRGQGALGGSPDGIEGMDSMQFPDGADGVDGSEGRITLVLNGIQWEISEPLECIGSFTEELDEATTLSGVRLCGGNCLSRSVSLDPEMDYEMSFNYRWLTPVGTLEVRLAGEIIYSAAAPASLDGEFQFAHVITDPSMFFGELEVCLVPEGPAMLQLANFVFRSVPNLPPVITLRLTTAQGPVEFSWPSVTGRSYQLQVRSSLSVGDWTNLGPSLQGTGAALATTAPVTPGQPEAYYRVVISQ